MSDGDLRFTKDETNRKREVDLKIGAWLSAALEDPSTCQSMKDDVSEWFKCTPQMEAPKREWVGLTEVEIRYALREWAETNQTVREMLYAIEAKLKEKNT